MKTLTLILLVLLASPAIAQDFDANVMLTGQDNVTVKFHAVTYHGDSVNVFIDSIDFGDTTYLPTYEDMRDRVHQPIRKLVRNVNSISGEYGRFASVYWRKQKRYVYVFPKETGLKPLQYGVNACRQELDGKVSYIWLMGPFDIKENEYRAYYLEGLNPKQYWEYHMFDLVEDKNN